MGVVFSGDTGPDETGIWGWGWGGDGGCYRLSWTEKGPLKQRFADLAQTSHIALGNGKIKAETIGAAAAAAAAAVLQPPSVV